MAKGVIWASTAQRRPAEDPLPGVPTSVAIERFAVALVRLAIVDARRGDDGARRWLAATMPEALALGEPALYVKNIHRI